jgi:hypothetical protein
MTRNFECRLGRLEARARVGGVIVTEWRSAADDESLALARSKAEAQGVLLIVIHDPWAGFSEIRSFSTVCSLYNDRVIGM